ncbi:MAG: hypothetical protein KAZ71_09100 [Bacteroidia bacterium]|jgi:predicted dinucleotide-binding enzyme|nr:hypothetical protein [Bacteroidia bacterium]
MGIILAIIIALAGIVIDPTNGINKSTSTTVDSKIVIDPTNGLQTTTDSKIVIDPTNG